jgi:hypothetical protein
MPKPYSLDLRERVVGFLENDHSRPAAAHFRVSVSFVVSLVKAVRTRGSFEPKSSVGRRQAKPSQAKPSQAQTASVVSIGAGGREGRHHRAGTGPRCKSSNRLFRSMSSRPTPMRARRSGLHHRNCAEWDVDGAGCRSVWPARIRPSLSRASNSWPRSISPFSRSPTVRALTPGTGRRWPRSSSR